MYFFLFRGTRLSSPLGNRRRRSPFCSSFIYAPRRTLFPPYRPIPCSDYVNDLRRSLKKLDLSAYFRFIRTRNANAADSPAPRGHRQRLAVLCIAASYILRARCRNWMLAARGGFNVSAHVVLRLGTR